MLHTLIESNPTITYPEARAALVAQGIPEVQSVLSGQVIQELRAPLRARFAKLYNEYHNEEHSAEVAARMEDLLNNIADPGLVTGRERVLLLEAAWRHDDDHAGNTYRQRVPGIEGQEMSNEEWAVLLAINDTRGKLALHEIEFLEDHILATSFGQTLPALIWAFPHDPELHEKLQRDYAPKTPTQKLLALADVGGFRKGWDAWVDESLHLLQEQKACPESLDAWLNNRHGFVIYYIVPLLESVREFLAPEFFATLVDELQTILFEVITLKDPDNSEREIYKRRLDIIS